MSLQTMAPAEVNERQRQGQPVELIDVRTPAEYREVHVEGARLVQLDRFNATAVVASRRGAPAEPLYVICRTGSRARQACEKILATGFTNVILVEGGTLAWEQGGLPVKRGKKTISLERQVRIVVGTLVLTFTALGFAVHPYFLAIPAFVGAGNLFAGITDTCGMGLLLARMPWNQVGAEGADPAGTAAASCPR